jgi:hypothetical protein
LGKTPEAKEIEIDLFGAVEQNEHGDTFKSAF